MRVLLIGHPVHHSLSPVFQNAAFEALGLDHRYETWDVPDFRSATIRAELDGSNVLGANVTVPHKGAAAAIADRLTPEAELVGAVNTFFREPGARSSTLVGHNTDLDGFTADLDVQFPKTRFRSAVVIGAGGAARGVVSALVRRGVSVTVINRTVARAAALVESIRGRVPTASLDVSGLENAAAGGLADRLSRVDLVVDATSLGLGAHPSDAVFEEARHQLACLLWEALPPEAVAYDLKYSADSPFMSLMRGAGKKTVNGLGMLLRQGALAFERWTGRPAPLAAMREALEAAIAERA